MKLNETALYPALVCPAKINKIEVKCFRFVEFYWMSISYACFNLVLDSHSIFSFFKVKVIFSDKFSFQILIYKLNIKLFIIYFILVYYLVLNELFNYKFVNNLVIIL